MRHARQGIAASWIDCAGNWMAVSFVRVNVQKHRNRADEQAMTRSTRRRAVSVSVLTAVMALGLMGCGQDDAGPTAEAEEQTEQATTVPDRDTDEASSAIERGALDEAEDRFESAVGGTYVLTFELISQVSAEAGPIRVEVVDGRVVDVTYPDAMSEQVLPHIPMLTIADFFERARSVLADGGLVDVQFDEAYGHPLTMTLDPIPDAIDDEMSVVVRSVEPVEASLETDGY